MNKIKQLMAILSFVPAMCAAQTSTENYVKTVTMLDAGGTKSMSAVQYYNGLGYPTVAVSTVGSNGQTAATMTTYDALGREKCKFVPIRGNGLNYIKESTFISSGYYYHDDGLFTRNYYDALDRVTAVDIAGDKWRRAGKQNRTEYLANTEEDTVKHYVANPNGKNSLMKEDNVNNPFRFYPAGSLTKEIQKDADDKTVITFKDLMGNVILQRANDGKNNLDTYYVYDDLGRLCYVLSPQYQKVGTKAINCYEYRYDDRGRIYKKILPGCEYIQYWYDNADRVIAMQDGTLRKDGKFRLYMYDKLGRMVVQLLYTNWNYNSTFFKDNCAVTTFTNNSGFLGTGYSMISKLASQPSNASLEIVNYYDSYDFNGKLFTSAMPANITVSDYQKQYSIGSLTGTVVYATNGEALGTINVYDQKGQVVKSVRKGLGGYVEDVNNAYTFTGATDNTTARVNVKYGQNFVATTYYTYDCGKKTKMKLSVAHGSSTRACETEYNYDFIGRLASKKRFYSDPNSSYSYCSYTYDVHGWLTSIYSGGFQEELYYADGVDGGCYNGNISTYKWKNHTDNDYKGYILKYDGNNRLSEAAYGQGSNLSSSKNFFSEYVDEYDYNGNIKRLKRRGLTDSQHGGFGNVDDLYMSYVGNQLTSVRDNATHHAYNGATDFYTDSNTKSYALTYNKAGSLESDAGRKIAKIEYDYNNNPVRIQFTNGNVTKYIYSATGEKMRVIYQTAVANINVAIGSTKELTSSQIQSTETVDYLLGGALTLRNGRIDKYQFEEGYCQASAAGSVDYFDSYYYDRDHLGNIRRVIIPDDNPYKSFVIQTMDYYPFGAEFCDKNSKSPVQNHKYNGKEFDHMHGLNTYDYGARQYNPVTARWDRMDPLCEKYYSTSPYAYCRNNPVNAIDPNGMSDYHVNSNGDFYENTSLWQKFLQFIGWAEETDRIFVEGADEPMAEFAQGTIKNLKNKNGSTTFEIDNQDDANTMYDILTDQNIVGCSVEWAKIDHGKNGKMSTLFKTNHETSSVNVLGELSTFEGKGESVTMTHNHSLLQMKGIPQMELNACMDQLANPSSKKVGAKGGGDIELAEQHPKTTFILKDQVYNNYKYYNGNGVYKILPY